MNKLAKNIFHKFGIEVARYSPDYHNEALVSLKPANFNNLSVLLSYIIDPFISFDDKNKFNSHTNYWESYQIAKTYLNFGYAVDVISNRNKKFIPNKDYSIFIAARSNFDRIAQYLNKNCIKIVHLDTAHWLFNNYSALKRVRNLQMRKGITLTDYRDVSPNWAIENADCATILGNQFTIDTYRYARKPIFPLPVPAIMDYPYLEDKKYEQCKNQFLWLGSSGMVHKGLDLVLEAFAEMPEYHLTVCGPVEQAKRFENLYHKELYETPNIHTIGWIDVCSEKFIEITKKCIGLIYPSCSEGQAGSVITCIQAGLIPIISYESGVDVNDFGVILKECTISEIKLSIQKISSLSVDELEKMTKKTWNYARHNHTREKFEEEYRKIVEKIIQDYKPIPLYHKAS